MNKIEIKRKDISPVWVKIIGALIFLATAYKIITLTFFNVNPLIYVIFNVMALAIWTGKEIIVIDFKNNIIGDGFRILGITYLDKMSFTGLEKIFINKVNLVETFRPLTRTIDVRYVHYKAFLKTLEGTKICIGIDTDKDDLIERLKKYNKELRIIIIDSTSFEPITVD